MKNTLELIDIIRRETNTSANTAQRIADTMEAIVLRCNECERGNGSGLVNVEAGNGLSPEPNSFPAFNSNGELRMLKNYQEINDSYAEIHEYAKLINIIADYSQGIYIIIGHEYIFDCHHEMTIIVQNHANIKSLCIYYGIPNIKSG